MNSSSFSPQAGGMARAAATIPAALATLKDVSGIAGSFVFTDEGQVFAREMHAMFDDDSLGEAAERLTRLRDTFAAVGDHLDMAVIRYQDHRLYLKVMNGGMLCILADGIVNMAALRMAANMVATRIAADLGPAGATSFVHQAAAGLPLAPSTPSRRTAESPAQPAAVPHPPVIPAGMRRFRGRTVT